MSVNKGDEWKSSSGTYLQYHITQVRHVGHRLQNPLQCSQRQWVYVPSCISVNKDRSLAKGWLALMVLLTVWNWRLLKNSNKEVLPQAPSPTTTSFRWRTLSIRKVYVEKGKVELEESWLLGCAHNHNVTLRMCGWSNTKLNESIVQHSILTLTHTLHIHYNYITYNDVNVSPFWSCSSFDGFALLLSSDLIDFHTLLEPLTSIWTWRKEK